jgi:hypothetical protein
MLFATPDSFYLFPLLRGEVELLGSAIARLSSSGEDLLVTSAALIPTLSPQAGRGSAIEGFRAKWIPVRVKKTRQIKIMESRF